MKRKSLEVTINDEKFVVNELSVGQMMPYLEKLGDSELAQQTQLELISETVTHNGEKIDATELGVSTYMKLITEVMEVNGLDEGKD